MPSSAKKRSAYECDRLFWLEYFIGGRNANFFAPAIEDTANVIVPTISIFEVFKRTLVEKNREDALEAVAMMYDGKIIDLDLITGHF